MFLLPLWISRRPTGIIRGGGGGGCKSGTVGPSFDDDVGGQRSRAEAKAFVSPRDFDQSGGQESRDV